MRQKMKRLMGILLSLVLMLGLMPGMSLTALAYDGNPYASLVGTTNSVTFNGKPWYIIADNSTAVDAGTVTLLAADTSFGLSEFSDRYSNDYSISKVKASLDDLTTSGSFKDVADAIETNTDAGGKLYLLSTSEAQQLSTDVLKMNFSSKKNGGWWLRSPGEYQMAAFVYGEYGYVNASGEIVDYEFGVRPALKLNLSSVIFSSESKTFSLAPEPPVAEEITTNAISVTARTGEEYSIDGGKTWVKAKSGESVVTFDNLKPATTYAIVARMVKTSGKKASPASEALNVTTREEEKPIVTPSIYLASHVENLGWDKKLTELAPGETVDVGTTGQSLRMEALDMVVPENYKVTGFAHIQNYGDTDVIHVNNPDYQVPEGYTVYRFGTTGRALRMEAVEIHLLDENGKPVEGFQYASHLQDIGWEGYVNNGSFTGTRHQSRRLEALRFAYPEADAADTQQ